MELHGGRNHRQGSSAAQLWLRDRYFAFFPAETITTPQLVVSSHKKVVVSLGELREDIEGFFKRLFSGFLLSVHPLNSMTYTVVGSVLMLAATTSVPLRVCLTVSTVMPSADIKRQRLIARAVGLLN